MECQQNLWTSIEESHKELLGPVLFSIMVNDIMAVNPNKNLF